MSVTAFRECIAESLLDVESTQVAVRNGNHELVETEERRRYNTSYQKHGRQYAIKHGKQVSIKCTECPTNFMCMQCFFESLKAVKV
jgi:endonuclease III